MVNTDIVNARKFGLKRAHFPTFLADFRPSKPRLNMAQYFKLTKTMLSIPVSRQRYAKLSSNINNMQNSALNACSRIFC
jgi:hypothetical protein